MYGRFYLEPTYLMLVPAIVISLWAQFKLSSVFHKYNSIRSFRGFTGAQVARILLNRADLNDIPIEVVSGNLSDHYDPTKKVLRLSSDVYNGNSLASIGVAAHEVGHAIQHKEAYGPLEFRSAIVPLVNIATNFSWILFFIGILVGISGLVKFGIVLFAIIVIFQLVTLPVEFNASSKALNLLENNDILSKDEIQGAKKVLSAAALTYVASTIMAISQLLRLIEISNRNSQD